MKQQLKSIFRSLVTISNRERKRILWLLPLLVLISLLFFWQAKPRFEQSFTRYSDRVIDSIQKESVYQNTPAEHFHRQVSSDSQDNHFENRQYPVTASQNKPVRDSLFLFDPNVVSLEELVLLGFSQRQAQGILNYREAGKVFHTADDFADCYTVSDEKFRQLRPYIRITLQEKSQPREEKLPGRKETEPLTITPPELPATTPHHEAPSLLELNGADSLALVRIRGIGALTAGRIIAYRERLGGFCKPEQLAEIQGMTEQNYELILQQIFVDSSKIQKNDINFAPPEQLRGHPYLPSRTLNKILKHRQLKGGWSTIRELTEDETVTREEAEKLSAYLYFSAH